MKKLSVFDSLKRAAKKTTRFGSCSSPTSVLSKAPPIHSFSSFSSSGGTSDDPFCASGFSRKDLEATLRRLVPDPPTEEEVTAVLGSGGGDIRLADLGPPAGDELREAFSVFDVDGDGRISAEELLRVLVVLGDEACSVDDCRRMIQGVDTEGDGFVCFDDFARMMDCHK